MKVCAIVQARMNSSRLPGKVLKKVLDRPLLEYELERLKRARLVNEIVVATSDRPGDDVLEAFCADRRILCVRGPEEDVLARFYQAASLRAADVVVRVTGDCPLVDPEVVYRTVQMLLEGADRYDYVCNFFPRSFPRGLDCEALPFRVLENVWKKVSDKKEREHVTSHIYTRPLEFRIGNIGNTPDRSAHRWTVDTPEDFDLIEKILIALYPVKPAFNFKDVLELLSAHPEWAGINQSVQQKSLYE